MNPVSAIVLYAIIWMLTLFVILPQNMAGKDKKSQSVDSSDFQLRKKVWVTSAAATAIWALIVAIIASGWINIEEIDPAGFNRN